MLPDAESKGVEVAELNFTFVEDFGFETARSSISTRLYPALVSVILS